MRSLSILVTRLSSSACITALALLGITTNALAQESVKLSSDRLFSANISGNAYNVSVANAPGVAQSIRITGPRGFSAESASMNLTSVSPLPDGHYSYEITGATRLNDAVWDAKSNRENGRDETARQGSATGVIASGHFTILNGRVVEPGSETE